MSGSQQVFAAGPAVSVGEMRPARGHLRGSDLRWAIAFIVPYAAVFVVFVVYPFGYALWMASKPALYRELIADELYLPTLVNTLLFVGLGVNLKMFLALLLSGFFLQRHWWIKALLAAFLVPWAIAAAQACVSFHWMLIGEQGLVDRLLSVWFGIDGPIWFNYRSLGLGANILVYIWKWMPFWTVIFLAARMTIPRDIYDAAEVDGATGIRRFIHVTFPMMANLYLICTLLSVLWTLRRLYDCLSRIGRRAGEFNASAGDPRFRLRLRGRQPGSRRRRGDVGAAGADPDRDHADAPVASERDPTMTAALADHATPLRRTRRRRQLRRTLAKAGSIILGIVLLIWSLLPVYNMLMIALDPEEGEIEFTGNIWPDQPSLDGFRAVVTQEARYLEEFWHQFGNSVYIGLSTVLLTVLIGSLASFAVNRMRLSKGSLLTNAALLTYMIPASFLIVPYYRIMNAYGLLGNQWAVIAAQVTFATPFAILILQLYGRLIPVELDDAARVDGASAVQVYLRVYLPLMTPALAVVAIYALLLAWNDYLYQSVLLTPRNMTVAVTQGQLFTDADAPWNAMMAAAVLYVLPPIVLLFALRRYVAASLSLGAVEG